MTPSSLSPAKERILRDLKASGPRTAAELAQRQGVTSMAIRQHLDTLAAEGLVEFEDERGRVGRPRRMWGLADDPRVHALFPDTHAELTVGLISAARKTFGDKGLDRLIRERARQQAATYRDRIPEDAPLGKRVAALARIRSEEGYMATWTREGDGFLLAENHCPICEAATGCLQLCRAELDLFKKVLGPGVSVQRVEYLLDGGRRCTYRIVPA